MKNLTPVLIAFLLGMVLCFTIQACGDDGDDRIHPNSNSSAISESYGWDTEKYSSEETYSPEGGMLEVKKVFTYDSKGRLIGEKLDEYDQNGVLVLSSTYTYTYEGNRRIKRDSEGGKWIQTLYEK